MLLLSRVEALLSKKEYLVCIWKIITWVWTQKCLSLYFISKLISFYFYFIYWMQMSLRHFSKHTHESWSWWGFPSRAWHSAQAPRTPEGPCRHACVAWGDRKMLGGQTAGSHLTCTAGSNPQRAVSKSGWWPDTGDPSTSLQRGLAGTLKILNILYHLSW